MTRRFPVAAAAIVGLAVAGPAAAQPVAPAPRPTFTSYGGLITPGAGFYGYGRGYGGGFGAGGGGFGLGGGQQNMLIQQQLSQTNQSLANLQTFLLSGVNANLPVTGRGAVFNSLGHWYPQSANGGGGGGGGLGGFSRGMSASRTAGSGMPVGGGAGGPTTAGTGVPLGGSGGALRR